MRSCTRFFFHSLKFVLENINEKEEFSIPKEVNEETTNTVEELVKYFASQRSVMNKVIFLYSTFLVVIGLSQIGIQ